MIGKRNNVRRTKYEKDLTIVIIINCIGGLVLLAGSVLIIAFEIGIETPIEKYLMCAFILFSILLIVSAVCRQFKHRNDLYDEYEKNLNEIMGEIRICKRSLRHSLIKYTFRWKQFSENPVVFFPFFLCSVIIHSFQKILCKL